MGKSGEIVRAIYEAFGRGDVPAVLGAFATDIQWFEAEGFLYAAGNPYVGPQGVAQGVFMRIMNDLDQFQVLAQQFIESDDAVAVEGRYRGVMKNTGTQVDAQFAHFWRLRDGKIARFQQYTDTRQWSVAASV